MHRAGAKDDTIGTVPHGGPWCGYHAAVYASCGYQMEHSLLGCGRHAATIAAFALLAACGGGGGSSSDMSSAQSVSTPASVSIASVTPPDTAANVPVTSSPAVSFTIANGSYLSHTLKLACGGNDVATSQNLTSVVQGNLTTQVITLTPVTSLPYGMTCQLQGQVNASPSGGTSGMVSASFTTAQSQFAPKLIAGGSNGAGSIIDLTTGAQSLLWNSGTCSLVGASLNPASGKVHLSCTNGAQPQLTYDPATGALNTLALPPVPLPAAAAPVACARTGKCYYGFGQEGTATSDSRVVVVQNGNVVSTIVLPGQSFNRIPTSLKVVGTKLWVLEQQPLAGTGYSAAVFASSLSRVDLNTEKIDFTYSLNSKVVGVAANELYVVVSVYRSSSGKDVLVFDAATGASAGSIVLPSPTAVLLCGLGGGTILCRAPFPVYLSNAFDVAISGSTLYVIGTDGLYAYSLVSLTQLPVQVRLFGTLAVGNGKLYVGDNVYVHELDRTTLDIVRRFDVPYISGALYVAEPQ